MIAVWEKFSEAEGMVTKEAGAAATLYRLAAGPEPEAAAAKAALNNYLKLAIERDCPRDTGADAPRAHRMIDAGDPRLRIE